MCRTLPALEVRARRGRTDPLCVAERFCIDKAAARKRVSDRANTRAIKNRPRTDEIPGLRANGEKKQLRSVRNLRPTKIFTLRAMTSMLVCAV